MTDNPPTAAPGEQAGKSAAAGWRSRRSSIGTRGTGRTRDKGSTASTASTVNPASTVSTSGAVGVLVADGSADPSGLDDARHTDRYGGDRHDDDRYDRYDDGYDDDRYAASRYGDGYGPDDGYDDGYNSAHGGDGGDGGGPVDRDPPGRGGGASGGGGRGRRRRRRRLRRRWLALIATGMFFVLLIGTAGIFYAATKIPLPGEVVNPQTSVLTYADGKTELARVFAENRTDVKLSQVPKVVQNAVLAAENRGFYRDPGFDWKGITRAVWNNVRGRDVQGGSTITQQYVKNAYLTQERTYTRKFKELVISIKLDRQYTKSQILEWYLNTVYFGRGAYGIEAAAETYFGKSVDKLSAAEGAVLASSLRSPALYDPENHPERAKSRWTFVLDGMVKEGWLSDADRAKAVYPKVQPRGSGPRNRPTGPEGHVVQQVKEELTVLGIDEGELNRAGLRVQTTIDKHAQDAATTAVSQVFQGQPDNLRQALVAVDPQSGGVLAYYGGSSGVGFDYAQAWRPAGSAFKPYTLAAALADSVQGETLDDLGKVTVNTRLDGSSPRTFQGVEVHNSENAQCHNCSILEAMKRSINTVFYDLALQVGPDKVADVAHRMGIAETGRDNTPTLQVDGRTDGSIGIGRYEVRPIDQATGFATFASGGVLHPTHFVQKVTNSKGEVLYDVSKDAPKAPTRVIDAGVANDVTVSMEPIAAWSHDELADARPSAAKTGTQQLGETADNQDAWMVGFTPQISTAVWVGTDQNEPLRNAAGRIVFGSGLPGKTWQAFMNEWLADKPVKELPDTQQIKGEEADDPDENPVVTDSPTPTRASNSPSPTPSNRPTDRPTPTPTATDPTPTQPPATTEPAPSDPPSSTVPTPTPPVVTRPPGGGGNGTNGQSGGGG